MRYPTTPRGTDGETLHGIRVEDPYRWLEETESEATRDWMKAQNELARSFLSSLPERESIRRRLEDLCAVDTLVFPIRRGKRYFFYRKPGGAEQFRLVRRDGRKERIVVDPTEIESDGTVALTGAKVSDDGKRVAYGLSEAGSDWQTWRVRDVETGKDWPEPLRWIKFPFVAWAPDGLGLFYTRYDELRSGGGLKDVVRLPRLCYHRLGTDPATDKVFFFEPRHPDWTFVGRITDDGSHLVIVVSHAEDDRNRLLCRDLRDPLVPFFELASDFRARYVFVGSRGSVLWFRTDLDAPRGRLVAFDLTKPAPLRPMEVLAERSETLERVSVLGSRIVATYLRDARHEVRLFSLQGAPLGEIPLPGKGTVEGFEPKSGSDRAWFSYSDFFTAPTLYEHDFEKGTSKKWLDPGATWERDAFVTEQSFVESHDGASVPIFVVAKRKRRKGPSPALLYAYGGFGISLTPSFSAKVVAWLERGGVFVVANVRGGGEYGSAWHEAGMGARKENVFRDFLAVSRWLVAREITTPDRLGIEGKSNGGLLVAVAMQREPAAFGAVVPGVGVHDMIRFPRFTIGWSWKTEYGDPDDPDAFCHLLSYSPVHNARPAKYPATLLLTADHDDRVFPAHSLKLAAALQFAQRGEAPILLRIEGRAGHGAGTATSKWIDETADVLAFLEASLRKNGPSPRA